MQKLVITRVSGQRRKGQSARAKKRKEREAKKKEKSLSEV
jgi:hypothetical protein